jgi:hypothetical protein
MHPALVAASAAAGLRSVPQQQLGLQAAGVGAGSGAHSAGVAAVGRLAAAAMASATEAAVMRAATVAAAMLLMRSNEPALTLSCPLAARLQRQNWGRLLPVALAPPEAPSLRPPCSCNSPTTQRPPTAAAPLLVRLRPAPLARRQG